MRPTATLMDTCAASQPAQILLLLYCGRLSGGPLGPLCFLAARTRVLLRGYAHAAPAPSPAGRPRPAGVAGGSGGINRKGERVSAHEMAWNS